MKITKYESNNSPKYKAVVFEPEVPTTSSEVMLFLHGTGATDDGGYPMGYFKDENFEETTYNFKRMRQFMGDRQPKYTIAISFDKSAWVLSDEKDRKKGARDASFENYKKILNEIEVKHGIPKPQSYLVSGQSLGGFNALLLALHPSTQNMVKRALVLDPMLPLSEYSSKNPMNWALMNIQRGGPIFLIETQLTDEEYQRLNPITGLSNKLDEFTPPIQLHSSLNSEWIFVAKHNELEFIAHSQKCTQLEVVRNGGTHSFFNYIKAAEFLVGQ